MRKKIFTFLLALAASVGVSWATVITWNASKVSSMAMNVSSGSEYRTSDGITVTAVSTGEFVVFGDHGGAIEIGNGEGSGGGYLTFTSSVGNIAQIDINHSGAGEWRNANGDWISPYYINDNGGIFTWSGTPAASVTLTGDAPRYIYDITSIEFTIEDGGGSAQAGLQVTELQVPGSWQDNPTMLSTSDMPGFSAVSYAEAAAWDAAPAGEVTLIFAFEGDGATSLSFKNGVYQAAQAHNITYEDLYAWYSEGEKIFYTGGGSTPTGLQVTEFQVPASWQNDYTSVTASDLPGFIAVSYAEAGAWTAPTEGAVKLIYTFDDGVKATSFYNGVWQDEYMGGFGRWLVYSWASSGERIFYTSDGSTPAPANSCGDGLTWELNAGVFTISYDGVGTGVMDDFDYSEHPAPWQSSKESITSVIIPDGVTRIGNNAFSGAYNLASVSMGNDVVAIGNNAFEACNSLSSITLSSHVTTIGDHAFAGLQSLTSIVLPSTVQSIGTSAFYGNEGLTSITCEGTTPPTLGQYVFGMIGNGATLYVPYGYAETYQGADSQWQALNIQVIGSGSASYPYCGDGLTWTYNDGVLTIIYDGVGTGDMLDYGNYNIVPWDSYKDDITSVIIPDGVIRIGNYAFANLTNLASVSMGDDVVEIGYGGFWNCLSIQSITLGSHVTTIGEHAFGSNHALTSITLPNTLQTIGGSAFYNCNSLPTITIPSSVTSFGDYAFGMCEGLTSFTCEGTTPPTLGQDVFTMVPYYRPLYVPDGYVETYQGADSQWQRFDISIIPAPTPDPEPTPSATGVIFANCYDCWRSPDYPTISGQCYLHSFDNPRVGNNTPSGPWKLVFVENYNSSSTEYDSNIVKSDVAGEYGKNPGEMEVYRLYQWQNGAYQPVAYGVLYAYANENNPVEHAAFFEASGFWGCYLTDNTHSSGDNINILFNEDASTGFADLHGEPTPAVDPEPTPSGDGDKLAGAFSVGGDKVVYFSKANLQATTADNGATWTWGFAENQWDYVGNSAANNAINGGGTVSTNGPVDLFAWSSTDNNYFGINNSINEADYSGDFKDWGAKKGSDWRTLTINEWQYLLQERNPGSSSANHTSYPRYTNAQILTDGTAPQKDINGIILFPDDFNDGGESIDGVTWGSINPSFYSSYPTYCTTAGWATLESMGCVFLPSAGSRQKFGDEFEILEVNQKGNYWSSTLSSGEPEDPQSIAVGNGTLGIGTNPRYFGMSVRLVSETAPSGGSTPEPTPAESVTVVFEANNNQKEVEVTLPHTFACDFQNGNGELDGIIQELYALQYGGYCQAFTVPTSTGNAAVTASKDGNNHYITISEAFEGTATVTGNYIKFLDTEQMGNTSVDYTLTISVQGSTPTPAYTVAGEPAVAFGTPTWAPTNTDNDMVKQSNGTYKWEKEDVELAKDAIVSFKVCQDHAWAVAYPKDNFNHTIPADGIYTLTITFDPNAEGDKVAIDATKTADVVVAQTAEMKGFGDWNTGIALENINEGAAARVTKNLAAGAHEFKMIINDGWRGKVGATITRANNTVAEIVDNPNESNITLTADIPGDYTFTWTYETNTLSIEFPSLVVYVQNLIAAIGEVNLESGDAINAARTAYDNLLDADQKLAVNNYNVLEAAEAAYAALAQAAADQLAANNVKNLIDAIDNPVVYTNDCKAKIDAARAAYDALTEAQKTLVGDEYAQKLADAEAAYDAFIVYTIAGEPEALFGSFWNIEDTNNDMVKQSNGTYKWEKSEVALAAGIAKFKIIKDHVTYEYPTSNYELQIEEDGIYTVTIIYDPKAAEDRITTNATKTGEAVIVHTAEMKGSWNNWTDGLEFENINEGAAARATKILTPGTYEFKMIIDGSWLGEASTTFTRNENAKAEIGGDEDNLNLNADIPGCYTFTWTYETNTLEIGYPNYIDANLAIDFRTNPYSVVSGVEQSAGVAVEGTFNDTQHGYRLPVVTIPVTAGNYLVKMGTCKFSNQDGAIKNEDGSVTYATLATNTGVCYDANPAKNYVAAIITIPNDQIIKVYGAEYTPFFSIEKMAAVPAFTDFEINFQTEPYSMISGAKPEGMVIAGSFHDGDHGYQNVEVTVPMEAGKYRLTLGACQFGNGAGNVMSETNIELASFDQNLGENKCYHQNPAENIISMIFDVDQDQTITIDCGQYTPYMKLEAVTSYAVEFALGDAEGTAPTAVDVTIGESITMPVNKTMYKDGYTQTGWSDGVNTYPIGESFTPANDVVLTPVFTANEADLLNASTDVTVKWYFGGDNGAPVMHLEGSAGLLVAKATIGDKTVDVKLNIDATSGKFVPQPTTEWAQVRVGTIFTYPYKEGMMVDVHTYSGNVTYYIADGNVTCGTNDYYSFIEVTYPASASTTAVVIGDPNNASEVETFLSTYDGQTIDELIIDRPVLNNMYNTLCLPFDMNAAQIAASSLNGVEIREFTGASVEGTTLNLSVGDPVNAVVAGRPYFVKYSAASQLDDLHFEDVTINNALLDNMAVTFDGVTFKGTFTPFVMPNGLNFQGGYLFLGQNNQLFWPNTSNPLKPFRAYFYVDVESSTPGNAPKYRGMPARIVEGKNVATGVENAQSANQSTKVIVNGQLIIIKNDVRYNAQGQVVK